MVTKDEYFITRTKLQELRAQRTRLARIYDELSTKAQQESTERDQLHVLYDGLRQIYFADQQLHPDVPSMRPFLRYKDITQPSAESISFWRTYFEKELAKGRLRTEIVYIFGTLLEEWARENSRGSSADSTRADLLSSLLETVSRPIETGSYKELLDLLFAEAELDNEDARKRFQDCLHYPLRGSVSPAEIEEVLQQIGGSPFHATAIRSQAQRFLASSIMQKDLTDALTIMIEHAGEWNWPQEGVPIHLIWTMNKWRLLFNGGLPITCFLEIMGKRWREAMHKFFEQEEELQFRRQLAGEESGHRLRRYGYWSILGQRKELKKRLQETNDGPGAYSDQQSLGSMGLCLQMINAEVRLAQAAFPNQPLYLLKIDLQDYYPNLSHEMLLNILQRYGLSHPQLNFFRSFLEVSIQHNGQVMTVHNGVPNYHRLSDLLGELVGRLLEQYVLREAPVVIIRCVDDICFVTTSEDDIMIAWQAIQSFCQTCGLTLNLKKCGAICIGGQPPVELPATLPTWLFVQLNNDGIWDINFPALQSYIENARQQVMQARSLLARIEIYNIHLKYLVRALAMAVNLGETHRRSIHSAIEQFQHDFFGEGESFPGMVREAVQQHISRQDAQASSIPEAWFYWPITAGGCGLLHASLLTGAYTEKFFHSHMRTIVAPVHRPADWLEENETWWKFYQLFFDEVKPKTPVSTSMEAHVDDFIHRGSEVTGGKQEKLSPYWRWILYIYGQQMLEYLGTFRFLIPELVPLQLIIKRYQSYDETNETSSKDDENLEELEGHPF